MGKKGEHSNDRSSRMREQSNGKEEIIKKKTPRKVPRTERGEFSGGRSLEPQ